MNEVIMAEIDEIIKDKSMDNQCKFEILEGIWYDIHCVMNKLQGEVIKELKFRDKQTEEGNK